MGAKDNTKEIKKGHALHDPHILLNKNLLFKPIFRQSAQFFLYPEKLVVFTDPVGTACRTCFDLT
jgi:hypothetical protein